IRYFDTAPWYGRGLSELRTGAGLRDPPRDEYVLSTKVGRWLRAPADPARFTTAPWIGGVRFEVVFDYSYDGIMRAYEQSQLRLGLTRYDLAIIHDLDLGYHAPEEKLATYFAQLATSGFRALSELKTAGLIRGIGAGINALGLIPRFLDLFDMDFFLVAMPYTLLNQEVLHEEFPRCIERGIGFVIGAVFSSGILATGAIPTAHYNYAPAPPEILERVRRIEAACARHGVPLAAAALQFPLAHPSRRPRPGGAVAGLSSRPGSGGGCRGSCGPRPHRALASFLAGARRGAGRNPRADPDGPRAQTSRVRKDPRRRRSCGRSPRTR